MQVISQTGEKSEALGLMISYSVLRLLGAQTLSFLFFTLFQHLFPLTLSPRRCRVLVYVQMLSHDVRPRLTRLLFLCKGGSIRPVIEGSVAEG